MPSGSLHQRPAAALFIVPPQVIILDHPLKTSHTAVEDTFSPHSYWWLFRELLDRVKGDPISSVTGMYPARNQLVRARFDALEQEFEAQVTAVMREALEADQLGLRSAILDDFTQLCVHKVHTVLQELLSTFL